MCREQSMPRATLYRTSPQLAFLLCTDRAGERRWSGQHKSHGGQAPLTKIERCCPDLSNHLTVAFRIGAWSSSSPGICRIPCQPLTMKIVGIWAIWCCSIWWKWNIQHRLCLSISMVPQDCVCTRPVVRSVRTDQVKRAQACAMLGGKCA